MAVVWVVPLLVRLAMGEVLLLEKSDVEGSLSSLLSTVPIDEASDGEDGDVAEVDDVDEDVDGGLPVPSFCIDSILLRIASTHCCRSCSFSAFI